METLRNPFAVRNGEMVLIEDLIENERGLKCNCRCPACNGVFIARMGYVKIHHFAHSADACDEVLAYTSGLYRLIHQILSSGKPFYIPALVVAYTLPKYSTISVENADYYIRIAHENYPLNNKIVVSSGRLISFDSAEIISDSKSHMQAIELTYKNSKMAIKVMPPRTVCKESTVTAHNDMATLVLDFTKDANVIQTSDSKAFEKYLLSDKPAKKWIQNPKIEKAYPQIFALSDKIFQAFQDQQKRIEEDQRLDNQIYSEMRKLVEQRQEFQSEIQYQLYSQESDKNEMREQEKERIALGYEQVKDMFTQQTSQIWDSFGNRWIQCKCCSDIKRSTEFSSYGGANHVNLGLCNSCSTRG